MSPFNLSELLGWLGPSLLPSCVWVVAAILALARWQRHPKVSMLVVLGSLMLLVSGLGGSVVQYAFMKSEMRGGMPMSQYAVYMSVLVLARTVLSTTAFVLLVCAIFGWRRESAAFPRLGEDQRREINQFGEINRWGSEDIKPPR